MAKRKFEDEIEIQLKKIVPNKNWASALIEAMNDPEIRVFSDDLVVVIKDKYPKAKFHYLILPKENISNLKNLTSQHVPLLKHIESVAENLIKQDKYKNCVFKMGYHAEASMIRLHMHLISDDMNSPCLKTKKHWNSFTTDFFLDPKSIRESLEESEKLTLPSREKCTQYLNTPLKCHKCTFKSKNMPTLKVHLLNHIELEM